MAKPFSKLSHDRSIFVYALLGGLPALVVASWLTWRGQLPPEFKSAISAGILACWFGFAALVHERVVRPLQTMANLLLALREEDYSFRARMARNGDPLGDALAEINALGSALQTRRRGAVEAAALLRTAMAEIDVAVFAFDDRRMLRLANRAGQILLGQPPERLVGRSAEAVGVAECLEGEAGRLLPAASFPGSQGRWGLRRTQFREEGRPHQLVVIANLTQPLREEELKAWQGLVRVLGHELNNSLAPIKSIASSLGAAARREVRPADWDEDLRAGLDIIASRSEALARFLQAYSRLARLPPPVLDTRVLSELATRAAALETRLAVALLGGPPLALSCDPAQIEQALINLIRNAADAALERRADGREDAGVRLDWRRAGPEAEIRIEDDGPGIPETANLFVPFFTTKPDGSGIGLVLCRQIAENHGGTLSLRNRKDGLGCTALLTLPLSTDAQRPFPILGRARPARGVSLPDSNGQ